MTVKPTTLSRRTLLAGSAALAGNWSLPTFADSPKIQAVISAQNTRPALSPMLYGGFIEHIGNLINHSLWSEVLDDRKFYFGVIDKPETKPTDPRAAMAFIQKWVAVGAASAIHLDTENPYVGQHSPIITVSAGQPTGIAQYGLAIKASTPYNGRVVIWADSGVKVTVKLIWGDAPEQVVSQKISTSKKWQTRTFKLDPKVDTESARLEIVGEGKGRFGVGAVSLMPADNIKGFRADTLALMKEMRCPILRMPGGNFVSAYDWKDTIGDPDRRPPVYDPVWRAVQPNDVGVDELLQFCELIDSEPFWCVNTGFGEPRSGAELLEYVNGAADTQWGKVRAANGRKKPYSVKYWAVGNEMYGHWQMGHMARDQYTVKHNLFVDAMRAVDPSIYIVAPGGFVDEMTTGQGIFIEGQPEVKVGSERDWAYGMFKNSWGKFDALGTHAYPPQNKRFDLKTGKLFDVEQSLNEWARQPANRVRTMVDAWEEYKKHFPKLNEGHIKVFFDEWAYSFQDSLKNSLAIALAFHEFFRHTDFIAMAGFTMATGWLDFTRTASTISARGKIFQLYHQHFGAIPVAVDGNAPTPKPQYPVGGDQPKVNAGSATYPLDVSAALTEDGSALVVAVVNATEQAQPLALDIRDFAYAAKGKSWKFTGLGAEAKNAVGKAPEVLTVESEFDATTKVLNIAAVSVEFYRFERA
jgi:alpha-N-arabinofuranosidase